MSEFEFRNGTLCAEATALPEITEITEKTGTPFYCYSATAPRRNYRIFSQAFADMPVMICYAIKAISTANKINS
jgi:diaminopimelate decarboxylase